MSKHFDFDYVNATDQELDEYLGLEQEADIDFAALDAELAGEGTAVVGESVVGGAVSSVIAEGAVLLSETALSIGVGAVIGAAVFGVYELGKWLLTPKGTHPVLAPVLKTGDWAAPSSNAAAAFVEPQFLLPRSHRRRRR